MVLMHALHRLNPSYDWRLTVAHFNHQLRGIESDQDEEFVVASGRQLGVPVVTGRGDVLQESREAKVSIEMAARTLRHRFLAETAQKCGAGSIALGQHADDQVELFFLRLLRGGGGKAGMSWRNPSPANKSIWLVRPFLDATKESLKAFAAEHGIAFREDSSNTHKDILRNRIRHGLIPLLKSHYAPSINTHILRTMEITSTESEFVGQLAAEWLKAGESRSRFDQLPVAVQRQAIRLQLLKSDLSPDFELIETLRLKPGIRISQGSLKWVVREECGSVVLVPSIDKAFLQNRSVLDLAKPGEAVFGHLRFFWKCLYGNELENKKASLASDRVRAAKPLPEDAQLSNLEVFDADKVGAEISLRYWQAGDRFQPIGIKQPVKVQDLWVNAKVPAEERRQRVIGFSEHAQALFYVEGLRIGERFKLDKNCRRGLVWGWRREKPGFEQAV